MSPQPPFETLALPSGVELNAVRWAPTDEADSATGEPDSPTGDASLPWLLVHGLASNARLWDGVGARLATGGHLAVAIDQRGHGQSSKPPAPDAANPASVTAGPFDMATVADDIALVLDALGWERANIAGQSWGGNVVIEAAHRHPQRVNVVVGVDGGSIRLADQWPEWVDCAEALTPPPLIGRPLSEIEGWLDGMAADWPPEGRAGTLANFEVRHDQTIAPWLTIERHIAVLRGLWEHDPFTLFPTLTPPLLLIGAGRDGPLDDTQQARTDRMNQAAADAGGESIWFRPAHHDVHAQRPADVVDALLTFASTRMSEY